VNIPGRIDWGAKLKRLRERRGEPVDGSKTAGVLKKGPDGLHLDFIKSLTKDRKWKTDPGGLNDHPRKQHLKLDIADVRTAAVNPLIRMSDVESPSNGHDVQVPLTSNPYLTNGDEANAAEYENGYQFCQGIGHDGLNNAPPEQFESWASRDQAWRDGFAAAADTLGVPGIAEQIDATPKVARTIKMSAVLMHPGAVKGAPKSVNVFAPSNPNRMAAEFSQARRILNGTYVDPDAPTERIVRKQAIVSNRSMNYLAGGAGFGVGSDYAAHNHRSGLGVNDLPSDDLNEIRGKGRAMGALGAALLGGLGGIGLAWSEHDPAEWLQYPGDTAKNLISGSSLGLLGGFVPPAVYGASQTSAMLDAEAKARREKAKHDAQPSPNVQPVASPLSATTPSMAS